MKLLLPDPVGPSLPEALSGLEEGLRGPDAHRVRAQTQAQLQQLEQRVRAEMSCGAQPERYAELEAMLDACLAAQDVIACDVTMGLPGRASVRVG